MRVLRAAHLPLYRQSQIYAREGVELERSTLAEWVGRCLRLVNPFIEALGRYVFAAGKLHVDDTPVPVLDPGRGKTKTGRLWTYVRDDRPAGSAEAPAVLFRYSPDRRGERPRNHLTNFSGILQADAYAGFGHLYEGGKIREAACRAHARRAFYDFHQATQSPIAAEALERIGAPYAIETEIRGRPPDERAAVRHAPEVGTCVFDPSLLPLSRTVGGLLRTCGAHDIHYLDRPYIECFHAHISRFG